MNHDSLTLEEYEKLESLQGKNPSVEDLIDEFLVTQQGEENIPVNSKKRVKKG
jgi:hypothetical protein